MIIYNDSLDDTFTAERTNEFTGGVFSFADDDSTLANNQLSDAINVDIGFNKRPTTRRGTSILGSTGNTTEMQGLFFYDDDTNEMLLGISGSSLKKFDGTSWGSILGTFNTGSTTQYHMAQLVDKTYIVNGTTAMNRWTGSTLEVGSVFFGSVACPDGMRTICRHQNRIVAMGNATNPDWIYPSDILDGTNYPTANIIKVGGSDGDPIIGGCQWVDYYLFVAKQRELWVVDTSQGVGASATLKMVHDTIGCVSHRSIALTTDSRTGANDILFLAKSGVHSLRKTIQGTQQGISEPVSLPVQDIIERINWAYADKSCGIFWNNRYFLSVPIDSSTYPDYTLVYNLYNASWSGYWTGWTPRIFCISAFSSNSRLNFGDQSGNCYQWLDYVATDSEVDATFQDNGTDIATTIQSKGFDCGEKINFKHGHRAELEFFNSSANCDVQFIKDNETASNLLTGFDTNGASNNSFPASFPIEFDDSGIMRVSASLRPFGRWRQAKFKITSTSGKLSLMGVNLTANVRSISMPV